MEFRNGNECDVLCIPAGTSGGIVYPVKYLIEVFLEAALSSEFFLRSLLDFPNAILIESHMHNLML